MLKPFLFLFGKQWFFICEIQKSQNRVDENLENNQNPFFFFSKEVYLRKVLQMLFIYPIKKTFDFTQHTISLKCFFFKLL